MKRSAITRNLPLLVLLPAMLLLIAKPQLAATAVTDGLRLCARVLIPALFPFFVCADLFTSLGYAQKLSTLSAPLMKKLFGTGGAGAAAFLLGLVGGYPSGAQVCADLYTTGAVSEEEANRLVLFCSNAGPAFVFGVMGAEVFASVRAGLVLYASQILSAIGMGLLLKRKGAADPGGSAASVQEKSVSECFTHAVKKAGQSVLQISMFVTIFSVISTFALLPLERLVPASVLPLLRGALELSGGAEALKGAACPFALKLAAAAFLLAFSGLSVLAQTACVLSQAGLHPAGLLGAKLLQGLLAAGWALLLAPLIPYLGAAATFSIQESRSFRPSIAVFSVAAASICFIFLKLLSGNRRKNGV